MDITPVLFSGKFTGHILKPLLHLFPGKGQLMEQLELLIRYSHKQSGLLFPAVHHLLKPHRYDQSARIVIFLLLHKYLQRLRSPHLRSFIIPEYSGLSCKKRVYLPFFQFPFYLVPEDAVPLLQAHCASVTLLKAFFPLFDADIVRPHDFVIHKISYMMIIGHLIDPSPRGLPFDFGRFTLIQRISRQADQIPLHSVFCARAHIISFFLP